MPQTCHHPSAITPGLFQLTAIRTTRFQHKRYYKRSSAARLILGRNAKHSSMENTKQLHWLPKNNALTIKFSHWSINVSTKKHLNTYKTYLMKKWQEDRDYNLKNKHNWKYHPQKTRPLPVKVSVYMHQPNGTNYPTPLGMNTTLTNSKNCSKLISSTKPITNKSYVKHLS